MIGLATAAILVCLLAACGRSEDEHVPQPKAKNELELIRNTEKIGYSGNAVADKVQGAIDENNQRSEHLEQAQGWATGVEGEDEESTSDETDLDTE
ncbi:MAG TPA: hypothetical protein VJM11_01385 [Nevskiaceae bacterium]|nr:hypothetical protein [Nevskiaceae bacterium]